MRRYEIDVDNQRFTVDVQELQDDRYRVAVAGHEFEVAVQGESELAVAALPATGAQLFASLPAMHSTPPAAAAPVRAAPPAARAPGGSTRAVNAPMPGVILRLLVAPGAHVVRGQDIAVLEAMKMENMLRAPQAGRVEAVCVEVGQQVSHGQAIVHIAATGAGS